MSTPQPQRFVTVIGAGTMGVGIAYVFAAARWTTYVVEPNDERVVTAQDSIRKAAKNGYDRGRLNEEDLDRLNTDITFVKAPIEVPLGMDLVIETVPEQLELKRAVLRAAEALEPAILASNTSSLSIDELAIGLAQPDRFIGMHFFNPVWSFSLVELVRGSATDDASMSAALEVVESIGKQAAVVKDSPGFATSRLDLIAALEAIRMVEQGVGSPEDIDRAIQLAYRHPVGPLKLSDIVGLDVRLDIARRLSESLGERFSPPQLLIDMVNQGTLGEKTGQGFYSWPNRVDEA
jgi:3-hydroxybutyryl-CoA dehydrogenase